MYCVWPFLCCTLKKKKKKLLKSVKDKSSCRTVVKYVKTKSPLC